MKRQFNIVVVGAGVVGLTFAARLSRFVPSSDLSVTVVDAGPRPVFDAAADISLRVSAIAPGSVRLFDALGAWSGVLAARAAPFRDMIVWDHASSVDAAETLCFHAAEFAVPELGFIVENTLLQHALLAALDEQAVATRFATPIRELLPIRDRFELVLESGEVLKPDLLVGADGADSFVRQQAGIGAKGWAYAQKAFVTHCHAAEGHRDTAWQRFLPDGPIGLLPLPDGRISIVWSTTPDTADRALAADDDALGEMLTGATDGALGAIRPAAPRAAFPLRAQHAERYVLPGLALIGDAAHAVHPLAGQGANLGIADADELVSALVVALRANEHPGDLPTLRRYERARQGANRTMLHFVDGLNRLFSNESPALASLRGAGMAVFNRSGPVRSKVVQTALGLG